MLHTSIVEHMQLQLTEEEAMMSQKEKVNCNYLRYDEMDTLQELYNYLFDAVIS